MRQLDIVPDPQSFSDIHRTVPVHSTHKHPGQSPLLMEYTKEKKRHKSESETRQLGQLPPDPCCQVLLSNLLSIRNKVDELEGKHQVWETYRLVLTGPWLSEADR